MRSVAVVVVAAAANSGGEIWFLLEKPYVTPGHGPHRSV